MKPLQAAARRGAMLLFSLALAMPALHAEVFDQPPVTTRTLSMTRDELRACMKTETLLKQREAALDLDRATHNKLLASSSDEALAEAERLRALDGANQGALTDYNARNQQRNLLVEQINQSAEHINARTAAMQADHANYLEQCASKRYMLKDKTALLNETRRATSTSTGLLDIKPAVKPPVKPAAAAAAPAPTAGSTAAPAPAADAAASPAVRQ